MVQTPETIRIKSNTTVPGLDAVRAFAALGVVLLHAGVPYLKNPMPGLAWPVTDQSSRLVDIVFWGIELFIMPIFLLMAGIFAWGTISRNGAKKLVHRRAKRLLVPLAFGMLVILPMDLYVWLLGWVYEGIIEPVKMKSLKFENGIDKNLWGTSHLWFLLYLFTYVTTLAFAWRFRSRIKRVTPAISSAILVSIGIATLIVCPEVVWGFQHAFSPVPSKWLYSGTFFFGGVLLAAKDPEFQWLKDAAGRLALPSFLLCCFSILLGTWHLQGGESDTANASLAALTTIGAWTISLCVVGLTIKHVNRVPTKVAYLAAASFWVYLVHHPFLGLIHINLKVLLPNAAPALKMILAFSLCSTFCLLTYEALVRRTRLGKLLGFAWEIPRPTQSVADPTVGNSAVATERNRRAA